MRLFRAVVGLAAATIVLAAAPVRAQPAPSSVTFAKDVAPVLFARCAGCHQAGGSAPFSLLTYAEVRPRAARIAAVVRSRQMPPWKPDPVAPAFVGDRRLSDSEIDLIERWVRQGALEGNAADLPAAPRATGGWQHGTPDLILQVPAYELPGGGRDAFRNFVVPVPGTGLRYVRGLEFHPNGPQVHHANIFVDATSTSRQLDDEDPQPGYDGVVPFTASFPDGHFLGWTPGQAAPLLPADQSWRLPEGSSLLVQMHLMQAERAARVQATVGLYLTRTPPVRVPVMLRLGRQNLDIPPGDASYVTTDSYVLPVDAEVAAIQPHAHHRARSVRAWADLPDGTQRELIRISAWDFDWQDQYRYAQPFWLPRGTRVTAEYRFDNSASNRRNPDSPPRRVVWGQQSYDEMADVWIQLFTRTAADLARLAPDLRRKMVLEDVAGHELELRSRPDAAIVRNDLAVLYLELGRPLQAAVHFADVAKRQPASAVAQYNLGAALDRAGRTLDAIPHYADAVRLDAGYVKALNSLGTALLVAGRADEAGVRFEALLRLQPDDPDGLNNLGFARLASGDTAGAMAALERAVALSPAHADAHFNLARVLDRAGRQAEAVAHLRESLRVRADWTPALVELAWLEATASDARVRSVADAVDAAERAVRLTGRREADALAVLAAAQAAAGQLDAAIRIGTEALRLAPAEVRAKIEGHLRIYRTGRGLLPSER